MAFHTVTMSKKGGERKLSTLVHVRDQPLDSRWDVKDAETKERRVVVCEVKVKGKAGEAKQVQKKGCFTRLIFRANKPFVQVCETTTPVATIPVTSPRHAAQVARGACANKNLSRFRKAPKRRSRRR